MFVNKYSILLYLYMYLHPCAKYMLVYMFMCYTLTICIALSLSCIYTCTHSLKSNRSIAKCLMPRIIRIFFPYKTRNWVDVQHEPLWEFQKWVDFFCSLWMRRASLGQFSRCSRPLPGRPWLWKRALCCCPPPPHAEPAQPGHLDLRNSRETGVPEFFSGRWLWSVPILPLWSCLGGFQVFSDSAKKSFFHY